MKDHEVIDDWVDCGEVRAMAEKLLASGGGKPKSPDDEAYGDGFEGFLDPVAGVGSEREVKPERPAESQVEVQKIPELVRREEKKVSPPVAAETTAQRNPFAKKGGAREGTGNSPGGVKPVPGPGVSPFRVARAAVETKEPQGVAGEVSAPLSSFVNWLRGEIPLEKVLIADGRGGILFDDLKDGKLNAVAKMLARAAHQKKGEDHRAMVVKLASKRVMQVIPFQGTDGASFAGLILPRPLADNGVAAFVKALGKALEPENL